jgi:KUP system potassium uptake protein
MLMGLERQQASAEPDAVFAAIGASPWCALREPFGVAGGPPLQPADPLGVLPLILWALILAILINYLAFGLCADNQREGGIIALVVLLNPWRCEAGEPPSIPMLRGCSALASCMTTGRLPRRSRR